MKKRPRPRTPKRIEALHLVTMRRVWARARAIIEEEIEPLIEAWPHRWSDSVTRYDLFDLSKEEIRDRIRRASKRMVAINRSPKLRRIIERTGEKIDRSVVAELARVLSIDIRADKAMEKAIDGWLKDNIKLINTGLIESDLERPALLEDIASTIDVAHRAGVRVEVLTKRLRDRFDVSESRAELIARDQVLKLNGQINNERQTKLGITEYKWSTSKDERVRPMHLALDDRIFSWDDPPEVGPGRHEHPGGDYQCRCVAIPIMPGD